MPTCAFIVPTLGAGRLSYYVLQTSGEARAWTEAIAQAAAKAREGIRVAVSDSRGTEVGLGPAIVGVGMGHVAGAGTPRGSADVGNGNIWVATGK
ncbi:hypothetical protein M404DRAFT_827915 [Pisolithus tinctorius Marx 270]|uniref:Uncharacterized protein n=1 Tax=Pisolithus tinctorius Marx 270 TaxID=870435 RepID=A0A0C3IP62_PISTI|nr:hypothetical protein M404DRAFT_827915 [Pisolithus tinctorius Marx 270]